MKKNVVDEEEVCIIADYMNRPSSSKKYFEREINQLSNVYNSIRAHSESFILLQLSDLLLGSVIFQWRRKIGNINENSNRAKAKKKFTDYLASKLNFPDNKNCELPFAQNVTTRDPFYFSVWQLRLS